MLLRRPLFVTLSAAMLVLLVARTGATAASSGAHGKDPLAAEIAKWSAYVRNNASKDDLWGQIKPGSEAMLTRADDALRDGRRLVALQRLAAARVNLAAYSYLNGLPSLERNDAPAFEREWTRLAKTYGGGTAPAEALAGIQPAAVRAVAEAALPQAREYFDASRDYAHNTEPRFGFLYLGTAKAQTEFVEFCRSLSEPPAGRRPAIRGIHSELDALEAEILAAYRPPASIDRHSEFIGVSAAVKEARELDAAGLRYGALMRYLQAELRFAELRPSLQKWEPGALRRQLDELEARLSAGGVDHTIGCVFLESARGDLAVPPATGPGTAGAIASEVLPRYFAALEPAAPEKPKPVPGVTVTLVRWPYT
ncbi:MAG: hypothetical protein ABI592_13850 [Acidobacteriota bacterium]